MIKLLQLKYWKYPTYQIGNGAYCTPGLVEEREGIKNYVSVSTDQSVKVYSLGFNLDYLRRVGSERWQGIEGTSLMFSLCFFILF